MNILVRLIGITLAMGATSSYGEVTIFSDRDAWLLATGDPVVTEDFEGIVSNTTWFSTPPGVTLDGIVFDIDHSDGQGGILFLLGNAYPGNWIISSQQSSVVDNNLQIALPVAHTSVAMELATSLGSTLRLVLASGETIDVPTPGWPGFVFVGITSDGPIESLAIVGPPIPHDTINIDNFSFGDALPTVVPVSIDIKPGSDPNCFNANGHGVIPVAILGSDSFDVTLINQTTLLFGGLEVRVRGNKGPLCHLEDSNLDGNLDLVCQFEDNSDYWSPGDGDATLTGKLHDETEFEGTDSICVVP